MRHLIPATMLTGASASADAFFLPFSPGGIVPFSSCIAVSKYSPLVGGMQAGGSSFLFFGGIPGR
jgi:hypothetical protein